MAEDAEDPDWEALGVALQAALGASVAQEEDASDRSQKRRRVTGKQPPPEWHKVLTAATAQEIAQRVAIGELAPVLWRAQDGTPKGPAGPERQGHFP